MDIHGVIDPLDKYNNFYFIQYVFSYFIFGAHNLKFKIVFNSLKKSIKIATS